MSELAIMHSSRNGKRFRSELQSCRVEGCAGIMRWRDRQNYANYAFALLPRNSANRNSTISSAGSMASVISRAERRGGPTSRGGPQAEVHSRVGSNVPRVLGGIDLATFQTWNGRHS